MFDRIARAAYRRLRPQARNSLRGWLAQEAQDTAPLPLQRFDERRVLVLAPHPDDEVIGCGGVIACHVQAGARVRVLVMTDGRWGDARLHAPALQGAERERLQAALVQARREESRAAAALLGVAELHFLERPDGGLCADAATVGALRQQLQDFAPDLVYLPFVWDLHPDHWQTNLVLCAAAAGLPAAANLPLRGYEVWSPLPANRLVDISAQMPLKLQALAAFVSQLRELDYRRMVEGLNAYRSGALGAGRGHAEAFHELPLSAYQRLVRATQGAAAPTQRSRP